MRRRCLLALLLAADFPTAVCLPTVEDQQALWDNLASIDIFSVGVLPYELGVALGHTISAASGVEETLPFCSLLSRLASSPSRTLLSA